MGLAVPAGLLRVLLGLNDVFLGSARWSARCWVARIVTRFCPISQRQITVACATNMSPG